MQKHRFLFVSIDSYVGDIAWQVSKEGHEVRYWVERPECRDIASGFVEHSVDYEADVAWADVIVFDDTLGQGAKAHALRQAGKHVIGGTAYTDRLEDDRSFGQDELRKAGVEILPFWDFTRFDDAIAHIRAKPDRYVLKPCGEAANTKRWLFVGDDEDGSDVIRMLEAHDRSLRSGMPGIEQFQLQKRAAGVEVAIGAFFDGREFVEPINFNFEHKRLFPNNLGPSTGEMGTSMFWGARNRLFRHTLQKMGSKLRDEHYVGYIDLNCIVNREGVWPLEFTSRFGYPTIFIQQEAMLTPIGEFFAGLAAGKPPKLRVRSGFQVGVRVVVPPYPFDDPRTFASMSRDSVIVFKRGTPEEVHIEEVRRVNDQWLVAGAHGVVLCVVGTGPTMRQAKAGAYARLKNIVIPGMYYRDDISDRWQDDGDRLQTWGWLRED
ncbi:MAG: phosphoribosylglycinamide synthetase C domain-containing protein [Myxococcota bacterium]